MALRDWHCKLGGKPVSTMGEARGGLNFAQCYNVKVLLCYKVHKPLSVYSVIVTFKSRLAPKPYHELLLGVQEKRKSDSLKKWPSACQ